MAISQWDLIRRQSEAAARNAASGTAARVRRDASLVNQASQLSVKAMQRGENAVRQAGKNAGRRACQPAGEPVVGDQPEIRPAPDGYMRRSPVQPIYESADYRQRIVRRIVSAVIAVAVMMALVWLLLRSGILAF